MNIAITGLNNVDSPGPGVPVIRAIRDSEKFDGKIIGLMYDSLEPGGYMPGVADINYLIPYPSSGLENYLARIIQIHERENLDVIIPTLDAELYAFSKISGKLNELGIKTFLPTMEQLNLRAKDKLFDFCSRNDVLVPKNILISSVNEIYSISSSSISYPVAVKGIFYDAYIANNFNDVLTAFNKVSDKWGLPVIIQDFIKGDEYNVCALGDGSGETIAALGMKKMYITDKGKGWAGVTISDKSILEVSRKVIHSLNWRGGAEFEFVKEKETNKYYLLEINPRFPAWVYLTVGAGQNQPFALLELALGKKIEPMGSYELGKIFIRYSWDLITDIKKYEEISVKGEISHG